MIELQTALLIAGVIVFIVVAVISYDRYRSSRKETAREYESELSGHGESNSIIHTRLDSRSGIFDRRPELREESEARMEPKLKSAPEENAPGEQQAEQKKQAAQPAPEAAEQDRRRAPRRARPEQASGSMASVADDAFGKGEGRDELTIEIVARIPGDNPIKRDTALGLYRQFEFDIKKRHRIFGLLHPDQTWCNLEKQSEATQFTDFGISVQLADRSGPISESELNRFSQMILRFAEVFGRRFKFSIALNDALEHAKKLDSFCKKYDAVAILNVVARNQDFSGTDIHHCAREMGLRLNQRSIYEKRHPNVQGGDLIYSLASLRKNGELPVSNNGGFTTNGLTLFMNIPRSENPAQVFNDMVMDAKALCKRLDGKLVDQNLRGMTQRGLKRISQQIRQIVADMERHGIQPGSDKSLRLF